VKLPAVGSRPGVTSTALVTATVAALLAVSFLFGYLVGRGDPLGARLLPLDRRPEQAALATSASRASGAPQGAPPEGAAPPADLGRQLDPFWEAWNIVEKEYYRRPVDRLQMVRGAIKGLLQSLNDPHGSYLDPVANRVEKANLDGIVEGIGASVELKERRPTILAPIEDGPAAKAGLRTGDVILKVDGREVGTMSPAEVVALLRGPSGSKVRITVQRVDDPEGQPVEVEVPRARLEIETVSSRMVADGVGYIRVRVFGNQTVPQLTRALRDMRARRVRGLVLDLRDNPGGYLTAAVEVASQFVKDGKVVYYEEHDGQRQATVTRPGGLGTDLTLAVLVNRGTASASEIVAGAIRDQDRGVLIGESTFGKGSVQQLRDLSDGSAVRVTTGTWLTPNGKSIEGSGLTPGIVVKPTPEDERGKRDVALEKALEWFKVPGQPAAPGGESGAPAGEPAAEPAPEPAGTN
jgi:carboxyl-terminal processing protease